LTHPDFSGLWETDLARSTLRGEAPSRILVKIDHTDPKLVQKIHVTRKDGTESSVVFHVDTSGLETTNGQARTQARWVDSELSIESWMQTEDRVFHFKDYWSLSADGNILTMAHRDDDLAGQTSVLQRLETTTGSE
jgi:hypothetical protein